MKTPICIMNNLIAPGLASLFLVACSATPVKPEGADNTRSRLMQLQADPQLASRAPVAIKEAEIAVSAAETPQSDAELGKHLVLIADRKVEIARSRAQARLHEDQRETLSEQRQAARLEARTREADRSRRDAKGAESEAKIARADAATARTEADVAKAEADRARNEAKIAKSQADSARNNAEAARLAADAAMQHADDLQKQLTLLNAKQTDRGLVVTLGDILFDSGKSGIKSGATSNLGRLAVFLSKYPDRIVVIEGHTDDLGSDDSNQALSLRRANAVKSYLVGQGIANARITASGKGEAMPVASNELPSGRQQNRRVEVIIANPAK